MFEGQGHKSKFTVNEIKVHGQRRKKQVLGNCRPWMKNWPELETENKQEPAGPYKTRQTALPRSANFATVVGASSSEDVL